MKKLLLRGGYLNWCSCRSLAGGFLRLRDGIEVAMYPFDKVEQMILNGDMQEDRAALALLRWLKQQERL